MEVKRKRWIKVLSLFLSAVMVIQILPLTVFANEKASMEALEPALSEQEPAAIASDSNVYAKYLVEEENDYAYKIDIEKLNH